MKLKEYSTKLKKNNDNKLRIELLKKCFEYFDQVEGRKQELELIALKEGMPALLIKKHAKEYMFEILGMSEKDYQEKYILSKCIKVGTNIYVRNTIYNNVLLELMKTDPNDTNKIIEIIDTSSVDSTRLKARIKEFVSTYFENDINILNDLKLKINKYFEHVKEIKKTNNKLIKNEQHHEITLLINDYINSDCLSLKEYSQKTTTDINIIKKYLKIISKQNLELYTKYLQAEEVKHQLKWNYIEQKTEVLLDFLTNGITDSNNQIRDFDIIDYYELININFEEIVEHINERQYTSDEVRLLKKFINKPAARHRDYEIKCIYECIHEINCQKDANGIIIHGTGRIINDSEKEKIINYLEKIGVPISYKNYILAVNRYINNDLNINKKKGKILKKED